MSSDSEIRMDKFLWAVRIYKTRSQAAEECRKGRVTVNGIPAKPSRSVSAGEIISVKKLPVIYTYEVINGVENRQPAKLTANYIRNITPEEELRKLDISVAAGFGFRKKGLGRPTKKERRNIDRLNDGMSF